MKRTLSSILALLVIPLPASVAAEPEAVPLPRNGEQVVRLTRDNLQSLHFSPDGSVQILLPGKGAAEFRRSESGELIQQATVVREWRDKQGKLVVHPDCSDAVFSPDGRAVLLYNDMGAMAVHETRTARLLSRMTILDARSRELLGIGGRQLTLADDLSRVVLCQPGFGDANGGPSGLGWVFDAQSGNRLHEIRGLMAVAALKGGDLWGAVQDPAQKKLRLWDLRTNAKIRDFDGDLDEKIDRGVFSRDGQHLACESDTKRIAVWNVQSGRNELVAPLGEAEMTDPARPGLALSDDGHYLVAITLDRAKVPVTRIRVWDVPSGAQLWSTTLPRRFPHEGPALLPGGQRFAGTLWKEERLRIWDLRTGIEE